MSSIIDRVEKLQRHLEINTPKNNSEIISSSTIKTTTMQKSRAPITSHVLDTTLGVPAFGVPIRLYFHQNGEWVQLGNPSASTNQDGRTENLLPTDHVLIPGIYKVHFDIETYRSVNNIQTEYFYPEVDITFRIENVNQHYHVPLLLNPYGFSTYRGS